MRLLILLELLSFGMGFVLISEGTVKEENSQTPVIKSGTKFQLSGHPAEVVKILRRTDEAGNPVPCVEAVVRSGNRKRTVTVDYSQVEMALKQGGEAVEGAAICQPT